MFLNHFAGFPLAVKLGTISSEGKADVYSYSEDDMVEDPYLKKHLAHFGINMEGMKKVYTYLFIQSQCLFNTFYFILFYGKTIKD